MLPACLAVPYLLLGQIAAPPPPLIRIIRPLDRAVVPSELPIELDVALQGRGMWQEGQPPLCGGVERRDFRRNDNCSLTLTISIDGAQWRGERAVRIQELLGRYGPARASKPYELISLV